MKRVVSIAALALFVLAPPLAARAAATRVGFSARLADAGTPVTGNHTLIVSLFDVATGGIPLWTETHDAVPVSAGIAHAVLGSQVTLDDGLFNGGALFLEVMVDATTLSPRLEILDVPYAVRASFAGTALHAVAADALGTLTQAELSSAGAINVGSNPVDWTKLKNVPAGIADGNDANSGGTVTSVGATAPLSVTNGALDPIVSMPQSSATADGWLSSTDYAAFAGKQARVTGTCAAPGSVRGVSADGGVTCGAPALDCENVRILRTAPNNARTSGTATCAAGFVVTGGGIDNDNNFNGPNLYVVDSFPSGNGWLVEVHNATGDSRGLDIWARCCRLQ